jgi:putative membrane protein
MEVSFDDSAAQSMDKAAKHYVSLFRLPSRRKTLLLLAFVSTIGSLLSVATLFRSVEGIAYGILVGFSLFLTTWAFDCATSELVLKQDPIYDLRRTTTLSLFCWAIWFFFIFVGTALEIIAGVSWWIRLCLLGFSAVLIFRLIVFNSTSFLDRGRLALASVVSPCLNVIPFIALWIAVGYSTYPITFQRLLFVFFSPIVAMAATYFFLHLIDNVATGTLGIPALSLFKAFLLSWVVDSNGPLEEILERLSQTRTVELSLFRFESSERTVCMIVPSIHPGPFRNVGSSNLPFLLKQAMEKRYGCLACIPHGLFGHELDLASRVQNDKVMNSAVEAFDFDATKSVASPFTTMSDGAASASCQIFDDVALMSVTLAPKTTEDIPQELGLFVQQKAEKNGLVSCTIINAHNSINETNTTPQAAGSLREVTASCLEKAASMQCLPFEVGASSVLPEFRLEDGMGQGGITVIVFGVGGQKAAYVVIDGNNIVSGLREEILSALRSIGIDIGEVFSTDTHSVSGVVLGRRGYHPVGEVMNHDKLIDYVEGAAVSALADMRLGKSGCKKISVPNIKVIGREQLENLSLLTDKGLKRAVKGIVPICLASGILLMLFLLFM